MQSERLVVKYIKVNNCFAYLPDTWLRKLETKENAIEIEHKGRTHYASCNASASKTEILCLGTNFARCLGINEGDEVFISSLKDVPHLTTVHVTPRTMDDREILELQMEKVQSLLLSQIRVVGKGQPIVAWVSKFSTVKLVVDSLEPNVRYGKLEQLTEIHVANVAVNKKSEVSSKQSVFHQFRRTLSSTIRPKDLKQQQDVTVKSYEQLQSFHNRKKPGIYRIHPMPERMTIEKSSFDEIMRCPYHVFVPRRRAPKFEGAFVICRMKKLSQKRQYANVTTTSFLTKDESAVPELVQELIVKLFVLEDSLMESLDWDADYFNSDFLHNSLYVSNSVRFTWGLKVGAKVSLCQLTPLQLPQEPSSLELFSWKDSVSVEKFENYVKTHSTRQSLLLNSCAAIVFDTGEQCVVKISPENCTFVLIDEAMLKKLQIHYRSVTEKCHLRFSEMLGQENYELGRVSTRHLKNILTECQLGLDFSLGLRAQLDFDYDRENILISGDVGSGRTTVCKMLREYLHNPPFFVHTQMIDCRSLRGKKVEMVQKILITILSECIYYQPAVLFLDDLESITNASANDEENTPDAINAARISDMLINTLSQYQETYYVSIVATCAGVNKIGQRLRPAKGSHFFRTVLSIPNLEKVDRIDILQLMLGDKSYTPGDVNWDYYGNKTEGWMVQDLVDLAEKAVFAAWKRHGIKGASKPPVVITEEDVSIALKNCTPMSLQGIQLYKGEGHVWSDIGGLAEVKRSLIEILQWPLKYPEIFKNAPIKLQNGVLLYGMPGTGKTMLAKAIANECGVNLISVKGPELLSKYIGVSEESVRNVFERALRAKPCVLFFDEFDSLAPRRGHDSTGVTDRVVNQLLTQMDGVEDREGVAVVAASSRPDLLDPALLRPGRLDKSLYCPLPGEVDREEILAALCRMQKVNTAELNLKELSMMTSGFTGADLNAVVTQARLSAFEDAVADAPNGKIVAEDIKVSQRHLIDSVASTHPSLSSAEKEKYKRIYARFTKNDNFMEDMMKNQKATLA